MLWKGIGNAEVSKERSENMRTIIADPTRSLILGRPGENEATQILFPIAKWIEQFGTAGIFTLVHKRYNDEEVYPCAVTWNTEYVSWIINSYDVLNVGIGKAVLSYTISGQIVKSKTFDTVVMETVVVPTEAPDPYQDWVSQMTEMVNDIQLEVDSANEKLSTIQEGAEANVIESIKTADDVTLPITDKVVTLPEAVEVFDRDNYLKYTAFQMREMQSANKQLLFNGQPIAYLYADTTYSYFLVPIYWDTFVVYRINSSSSPHTYFYEYDRYYIVRDKNAERNKINAIKKADGTTIPIVDSTVTLPDYALVSALTDYYTKLETYSKTEVDNLIGQISALSIEIVQTLPTQDIKTNVIYLVPKTGSTNDVYDEYMYISNAWEHIGSTDVDLSNYYTKAEIDEMIGDVNTAITAINNIIGV